MAELSNSFQANIERTILGAILFDPNIFDEIRDSSDIFESKDFENLLRSSLAAIEKKKKNDSKKDNKKAGKEISDNEKQEEVANAAMILFSIVIVAVLNRRRYNE